MTKPERETLHQTLDGILDTLPDDMALTIVNFIEAAARIIKSSASQDDQKGT